MTTVSILVPCRNEQAFLGACLESLVAQLDSSIVEVLVVDGRSLDDSRTIVERFTSRDPRIQLIDNPRVSAAAAMNIGIARSSGDVIVRADAHCVYPPNYVSRLVSALDEYGADNVGATLRTVGGDRSAKADAIARALSHPFGAGAARFRIGTRVAREVETVPFGCFRRATLERIGPYRETLVRNEDDELNARIINAGGRVILVPDVEVSYVSRGTIGALWRQYFDYGLFKPLALRLSGRPLTLRQFAPAAWILALVIFALWTAVRGSVLPLAVAFVASYLAAAIAVSGREAWTRRDVIFGWWIFASVVTLHVAYGLGWWAGLARAVNRPRAATDTPELDRIRGEFRRRDRHEDDESRIDPSEPGRRFLVEGRERAFLDILRDAGMLPLGPRRVLDVGCGVGDGVARFHALGVPAPALVGIDLLPERLSKARARHRGASFVEGHAGELPFADGAFDIVAQSTMFSSMLDETMRERAAAEMVRVMKPGGVILWYDFWWNPTNRATRGVGLADLRRLFPDCEIQARRVTLAPPIARSLAAISWKAARALESVWLLRTHYCAAIRRAPARA